MELNLGLGRHETCVGFYFRGVFWSFDPSSHNSEHAHFSVHSEFGPPCYSPTTSGAGCTVYTTTKQYLQVGLIFYLSNCFDPDTVANHGPVYRPKRARANCKPNTSDCRWIHLEEILL